LATRRITLDALDEITGQIERYLLMQAFTSSAVGMAVGLIFLAIGMQHAAVWGVIAAMLHLVPYPGAIAFTGVSTLPAFMQFGDLHRVLAAGAVSIGANTASSSPRTALAGVCRAAELVHWPDRIYGADGPPSAGAVDATPSASSNRPGMRRRC
jgi:hypothetical protein